MNKPEPLKGKVCIWKTMHKYHVWDEQLDSKKSSEFIESINQDIRSAIEYLKKKMEHTFMTAEATKKDTLWYDDTTTLYDKLLFDIDKAFEDVMKDDITR